jgi:hypothetical protein
VDKFDEPPANGEESAGVHQEGLLRERSDYLLGFVSRQLQREHHLRSFLTEQGDRLEGNVNNGRLP